MCFVFWVLEIRDVCVVKRGILDWLCFEPFLMLLIFTYFSVNFSRNHLFLERFQWWLCPLRTSWPESIGKIFDQIKTLFWISIVYLARLMSLIYCSHIVTCLLTVLAYVVPLIFILLRFFCERHVYFGFGLENPLWIPPIFG